MKLQTKNVEIIADDFGYTEQSDQVMIRELETHRIQGVAILATHNLKNIRLLPAQSIKCLHINLIEGKPLSNPTDIPSLINRDGTFYPFPFFFMRLLVGLIKKDDIAKEIQTQLQTLINQHIGITEINSHQHTHALSPVAEIILSIAKKHTIENIRMYSNIKTYSLKGYVYKALIYIIGFLSHVCFYKKFGLPSTFAQSEKPLSIMSWEDPSVNLRDVLKEAKKHQIVCHPGLPYDSNHSYSL